MSANSELCQWLRDNSSGSYRKSACAADVIEQLEIEICIMKEALLWMADVHAANAEGLPKKTSKADRKRFSSICKKSAALLGGERPVIVGCSPYKDRKTCVLARLEKNAINVIIDPKKRETA